MNIQIMIMMIGVSNRYGYRFFMFLQCTAKTGTGTAFLLYLSAHTGIDMREYDTGSTCSRVSGFWFSEVAKIPPILTTHARTHRLTTKCP
jgi:hypothetical protein